MSDDRKISERYRELPREEPLRALDDAILAASRRAAETRPAPLVVPTGRRRWYFPLAAAAIIVLAVAVTIHVERERPDAEVVVQVEPVAKAPAEEKAAKTEPVFVPDPTPRPAPAQPAPAAPPPETTVMREQQPAAAADQRARDQDRLDSQRLAHERQRQAAAGVAASRLAPESRVDEPARETGVLAKLARQSPEQWLLGIDDLKRQGKHEEAEKQLAEFRKRYPGYRIPEAILQKFEK